MNDSDSLQRILAANQKALVILEEKAAAYTTSTIPVELKLQLDETREQVENLKIDLEKKREEEKSEFTTQEDISYTSPIRARVPDKYYINRSLSR